ncbi:MAG: M23 family metallopeptidase [Solirubrobacterales bacterium]
MPLSLKSILAIAATALLALPGAALADGSGGTSPDPGGSSGGSGYGSKLKTLPGRPRLVSQKLVDSSITAGSRAAVIVRIRRSNAKTARVQVRITGTKKRSYNAGQVKANSTQTVRLPALGAGRYAIRVTVLGSAGQSAARGKALRLTVKARPRPVPAPEPPTSGSGVFPVQGGAWSFGGDGARFGAGRPGHTHEGQDVIGASGLTIVAPLAGVIRFVDYQAGGAGRYVVMRADNGWDMMFAHLQMRSVVVKEGERVKAGQKLGLLGSTGRSSGPHLHFELWPDGWRDKAGTRPIDPLYQLKRWAG